WEDVVVAREGIPTVLICTDTTIRGQGSLLMHVKAKERKLKEKIILLGILRVTVVPPPPVPRRSPLRLSARVFPDYAVTQITWTAPSGIIMKSERKPKSSVLAKLPEVENDDTGAYVCTVYPWGNSSNSLLAFSVNVTVDDDKVSSLRITHENTEISTATQANTPVPLTCPEVKGDYVWLYWLRADAKKNNEMQLVYKYDRWRGSTVNNKSPMLELAGSPYDAEAGSFSFILTPGYKDGGLYICEVFYNEDAFSKRTTLSVLKGMGQERVEKGKEEEGGLELGCLYSERSQVISAGWKHQKKSHRLNMSSKQPGSISTYLPLPITSDTAGNYTCTIQLEKGQTVSATQAVNLPNEDAKDVSVSVPTPSLPPSLSVLLLLVPLVAAAVGVLLWRQKHISDRGIEQSLSVISRETENIYENPEDIRQAPPQSSVYMLSADTKVSELITYPHLILIQLSHPLSSQLQQKAFINKIIYSLAEASYADSLNGINLVMLMLSVKQGWNYQPRSLEKHSDSILSWASALWSLSYYSSPLLLCYLYRKGYICSSKLVPVSQYVGTVLVCLLGVACLRGLGRWKNSEYLQFISILDENKDNHTPANKKRLRCYDFDFSYWPSDFSWSEVSNPKLSKAGVSLLKPEPRLRGAADSVLHSVRTLPCHIISFLIVHSFGRRMLYPGSVGLLQKAMRPMLQQGQARLIEEFDGQRNKLVACDGNEIDTMFVDRRREGGQKGQTLVICCEGNAGFYEVGCMNTPLEGGYSVLGWNHPGFAGSTGVPFQNEANAMDVVIQYAVHRLGFQLSDIVVYAWSIGGFTASWAVMSYPEIQSVVLDASFDDLLPLALKVMPDSWKPLVQHAVRQYMNLNNADQLLKYQGPVLLIRRTRDEIITTTGPEDVMSNRGNDLLLKLLQFRYPKIMTEEGVRVVRQWLGSSNPIEEASVYSGYEVDDDWCVSVLQSYQAEGDVLFPWSVGEDMAMEGRRQLALFLARKYMRNFETTHCTPLPASEFHSPWRL
ncbi:hypothetical protein KUCAC02_034558, partial [Chaenocephalus aceratus]